MGDGLQRLFGGMREGLIDAVHVAGPWAFPGLVVLVMVLGFTFRDKVVSTAGLITILAVAALAVTVRAVQLGRF
jgi:hypothetical protein